MSGFLIAVLVVRVVHAVVVSRSGAPPARPVRARCEQYSWLTLLVWVIVVPAGIACMTGTSPAPCRAGAAVVTALLAFPWWTTRLLLIPLGQPTLAYAVARLAAFVLRRDREGGAVLAGVLALDQSRGPSPQVERWLESRLSQGRSLNAAGVTAAALLSARRGDVARARALLADVDRFPRLMRPAVAVRIAHEWLAVDAHAGGPEPPGLLREARPEVSGHSVESLQTPLDAALGDPALAAWLEERGRALHVPDAASVLLSVRGDLVDDLAEAVKEGEIEPVDRRGGLLDEATRRARARCLAEVEELARALSRRVEARREVQPLEELHESARLRAAHEKGSRLFGDSFRRLSFPAVDGPLGGQVAWLFNTRDQRAAAHAVIGWLHVEATAVGDVRSAELHRSNLAVAV